MKQDNSPKKKVREELLEGVLWVWKHPFLRGLALLNIGLTTSFATIIAIQVLFIQENLGLGSAGFGMLMVIAAMGAIIGGQLAGYFKNKIGTKKGMLISVLITGLSLGLVGLMSNWVFVSILFVIGNFSVVIWNVFRLSLLQRIVPENLLGRVLSVFRFVSWGMSPIGMLIGGLIVTFGEVFLVREFALRLPYIVFMVVQILCFFGLYLLLRRNVEEA
jgi:MFS family permease